MRPIDPPPPGLIAVDIPKATLLLNAAEYRRAILRGKWWRRQQAHQRRTAEIATADVAPGSPIPPKPIAG
jgi:hypothetical protein